MRYVECSPEGTFEPAAGAEAHVGPRRTFADGDPFLAGGGAVDLVSLDEVVWNAPREREEAGSLNVVGAVAFGAAARALEAIGWPAIRAHDERLAVRVRSGLGAIEGVRVLGPRTSLPTLPVASFVVEGVHHALVAARLAAEWGTGVRHGCFCAHPYLLRLLEMSPTGCAAAQPGRPASLWRKHIHPVAMRTQALQAAGLTGTRCYRLSRTEGHTDPRSFPTPSASPFRW